MCNELTLSIICHPSDFANLDIGQVRLEQVFERSERCRFFAEASLLGGTISGAPGTLPQRQCDDERRALALLTLGPNPSTMRFNQRFGDG